MHTPGPWYLEPPSKGCTGWIVHGGPTGAELATVLTNGETDAEADAQLIVAAPALYKALAVLLDCPFPAPASKHDRAAWARFDAHHAACEAARAALADGARGEVDGVGADDRGRP